jgi:hypothetical protein
MFIQLFPKIAGNVWRYVALAQSRGGMRFCTRGAMQGYDVVCLLSRWQKPLTIPLCEMSGQAVTPGGGPLTVPSEAARTADH